MNSGSMQAALTSQNVRELDFHEPPSGGIPQYRVIRGQRDRPTRDSVLSGNMKQLSLFSILQALAANNSTGNLIIHEGTEHASIYIERGQLTCVSLGRYKGPKAFYRLMKLQEGKFEFFSPGRQPAEHNMAGSLEWHLL